MQEIILSGHGAGGRLSNKLVKEIFLKHFGNSYLNILNDSSIVETSLYSAFTTDSYVVDPIFFPGGNIGNIAICGTINDLLVSGAKPEYISVGFILEEGFLIDDLEKITETMAQEASKANVKIVTGDTKVVKKGQCDKIFINTSGIGQGLEIVSQLWKTPEFSDKDKIIVSGYLGDHSVAVLAARNELSFEKQIFSDVAPLNELLLPLFTQFGKDIVFARDITRGGIATVLNEFCPDKAFNLPGIIIYESKIPVRSEVAGICEVFGYDPLYLANEGKVVVVVKESAADKILNFFKQKPSGINAEIIGEFSYDYSGKVVMESLIGGKRIVDMLAGEMLPRIC